MRTLFYLFALSAAAQSTPAKLDALVADACEAAAVNPDKDAADKAVADLNAMRAATGL